MNIWSQMCYAVLEACGASRKCALAETSGLFGEACLQVPSPLMLPAPWSHLLLCLPLKHEMELILPQLCCLLLAIGSQWRLKELLHPEIQPLLSQNSRENKEISLFRCPGLPIKILLASTLSFLLS